MIDDASNSDHKMDSQPSLAPVTPKGGVQPDTGEPSSISHSGIFSKARGLLSMAFADRSMEERFLSQHREDTAEYLRWACLVGAAIMIGFMWQDSIISASGYKASVIRLFGALPVSALAWYLSRNLGVRRFISYFSAFFWLIYACFTATLLIIYEPGPYGLTSSNGVASFLLLLLGVFLLSNLHFWASLLVGLLTLLIYTVSVALWTKADFGDFIGGDFLAALVIVFGLAAKTLFTDRARRRLFETSELLRQSYTMVEQQVQERTAELQVINTHLTAEIGVRKRAEKQLQDTLESLRKAAGATIQVMASAVEARDPYTAGHQIRSANLARAIATEMGLSPEKIEGIRMAGSIHDIGKLSIPAEILSKPTKLSEIEFSLIKEHARQGYEMLKDVESPWPLAEIVFQHHERMDGSGYPRNLKGDEILMEARILNVADVVEAMASHRPYRAGLGIDAALNEIEKNRGLYYDKTVADACLRLFREKGFQLAVT
jgi:HD-GYP domain-containing protein (c-di-GMP phosphodiesterase class II)